MTRPQHKLLVNYHRINGSREEILHTFEFDTQLTYQKFLGLGVNIEQAHRLGREVSQWKVLSDEVFAEHIRNYHHDTMQMILSKANEVIETLKVA